VAAAASGDRKKVERSAHLLAGAADDDEPTVSRD
jgi:hypothetical protein